MNQAMNLVIQSGNILKEDENEKGGIIGCVVRSNGSPSVVVRELGPRNLDEIPPSELTAVARKVLSEPIKPDEKSFRAILDFYGLTRLTAHGRELLGEILSRI
jgi:hypothetical protein|tara:strand:+ start:115 stop:423 length:309 start_codon:yes stop_codon:yes gene_type:complete